MSRAIRKLIQASDNELVVANFDMLETSQAINFALRVVNGANRAFQTMAEDATKSPMKSVRASFKTKISLGDSDAILQEARGAASSAYDTTSVISFYKKGAEDFDQNDIMTFRSEVERIIYEKRLVYTYRPVFNCDKLKVMASWREPPRSIPPSLRSKSSKTTRSGPKTTRTSSPRSPRTSFRASSMSAITRPRSSTIRSGWQERSLARAVLLALPRCGGSQPRLPLRRRGYRGQHRPVGLDRFVETLNEIHESGFEVAVLLSGKTLLLDSKIYEKCDAFFVDFAESSEEGGHRHEDSG
jgi:hypothetical protein